MPPHASNHFDTVTHQDIHHHHSSRRSRNGVLVSRNNYGILEETNLKPFVASKKRRRPRSSSSKTMKKNVSFGLQHNNVYNVAHINDMKLDIDISMIWYSDEEYDQMTRECDDIVVRHVNSLEKQHQQRRKHREMDECADEMEDTCLRGLEGHMEYELERRNPNCPSARQTRKENAWDAVLGEQEMQWMEGESNEKLIAETYSHYSKESQTKAELVGLDDC